MNLVRREEFDAVQAMAAKARRAQENLETRVAALEAKLGLKAKKKPAAAKAKRRG
jgi:BMFP domain-containing protein YqiC